MRLVGHTDLNGIGDGGEGLDLRQYPDGRRILFFAHVNAPNCLSTVDVTDPTNPKVLAQVPAVSRVVRCNSLGVAGNTLIVAQNTDEPGQPGGGARIYDVSDPAKPTEVAYFDTSGGPSRGAHSVWFTDGQYAYLSTGAPDFEPAVPPRGDDQFLMIVDVRDRLRPKEVGRWWMPGQRKGEPGAPLPRTKTRDGVRLHSVYWSPERPDRLYAGWIDGGHGHPRHLRQDEADAGRSALLVSKDRRIYRSHDRRHPVAEPGHRDPGDDRSGLRGGPERQTEYQRESADADVDGGHQRRTESSRDHPAAAAPERGGLLQRHQGTIRLAQHPHEPADAQRREADPDGRRRRVRGRRAGLLGRRSEEAGRNRLLRAGSSAQELRWA